MADENTFSQEQVNGLVGRAREEAKASATKELLKALGFESVEAGQEFVKTSKAAKTDFDTKLAAATTERNDAVLKLKAVTLEQKATEVGAELGLTPATVKQVVKLLDVKADTFDAATTTLKTDFETFLALPENKHFVTPEPGPASGSSRRPGTKKTEGEPDKFDQLSGLLRF